MAASGKDDIVELGNQTMQAEAQLGEVLAATRKAKNLTQQDVSNHLRFSVKQIDALENNVFSALPDATTTRGFIRNYAKFLELDAAPLLESYRKLTPNEQHGSTLAVHSNMRPVVLSKESLPWLRYILGSILVLLFLLAWLFYSDYMPEQVNAPTEKMPEAKVDAKSTAGVPLPELALPPAERQLDNNAVAANESNANVTGNDVVGAPITITNPLVDMNLPPDANKVASLPPQPGNQLSPNATMDSNVKKVTMLFSAQTWVSVKNDSGQVVFEKLAAAGSTESFEGVPPFNLVIGNAKAARVMLSEQEVDLAAHTKANVARIRLE